MAVTASPKANAVPNTATGVNRCMLSPDVGGYRLDELAPTTYYRNDRCRRQPRGERLEWLSHVACGLQFEENCADTHGFVAAPTHSATPTFPGSASDFSHNLAAL